MKEFPLPVRALGPASQPPEDVELEYLAIPREMNTFAMPRVPERVDPAALRAARDVLAAFAAALADWDPAASPGGPALDLAGVPAPALAIVDQVLGEGEVSVRIDGDAHYRIQESVFTGLWRVCALDGAGIGVHGNPSGTGNTGCKGYPFAPSIRQPRTARRRPGNALRQTWFSAARSRCVRSPGAGSPKYLRRSR